MKKHNAPTTFFVVGNSLSTSPDLVKRMAAEGHMVGNHTFHHPDMSEISTQETFLKELQDVETLFSEITGQKMTKYYRPPQRKYNEKNLQMAKDNGYKTFFWSLAYVDLCLFHFCDTLFTFYQGQNIYSHISCNRPVIGTVTD